MREDEGRGGYPIQETHHRPADLQELIQVRPAPRQPHHHPPRPRDLFRRHLDPPRPPRAGEPTAQRVPFPSPVEEALATRLVQRLGGVRDLAFSPSGDRLACAGLLNATNPLGAVNDPAVVLYDGLRGEQIGLLKAQGGLKGVAWGVRFHPDGFLAVAVGGSGGGHLLFYRPDQPDEEFHRFSLPNTARELDLHPDGLHLATAHHDGKLRLSRMQPHAQPEAS